MNMRALLGLIPLLVLGCGTPSLLITPVENSSKLKEVQIEGGGWGQPNVAIIGVEGMLINAKSGEFLQPTENPLSLFTQELNAAAGDDRVKALVLRINSPGGTVTCSDAMYEELLRFRAKTHKPVVASIQEVGASGAYYLSCGADKIVAQPTSVVGSIGVIFETFNISGTLGKIGAQAESIKSGQFKDMGSPFKALTPDERALMQATVDEYYARFLSVVTKNRPVPTGEALKPLTDGRVFSGEKAKEAGLVDSCGLLEDAVTLAKKMANVPDAGTIMYKRPYAYGGSIYADSQVPEPRASVTRLEIPGGSRIFPTGFYYLWNP